MCSVPDQRQLPHAGGRRLLLFFVALIAIQAGAQSSPLEERVFTLKNRAAHDILPLLRTVADDTTTFSADGGQLIVRGNPDSLTRIRALLPRLDHAPKNLLITVEHFDKATVTQRGGQVSAQEMPTTTRKTKTHQTERNPKTNSTQSIYVQEGQAGSFANMHTQRSTEYAVTGKGGIAPVPVDTHTSNELHVTGYLRDEHHAMIIIQTNQHSTDQAQDHQAFASGINTTVTVPLGQWVTLALTQHDSTTAANAEVRQTQRAGRGTKGIRLRVMVDDKK